MTESHPLHNPASRHHTTCTWLMGSVRSHKLSQLTGRTGTGLASTGLASTGLASDREAQAIASVETFGDVRRHHSAVTCQAHVADDRTHTARSHFVRKHPLMPAD
eukprot:4052784-Prymnesium_polylepis.2